MERSREIIIISSTEQIPPVESILKIPRNKILILRFENSFKSQRDEIANKLKSDLHCFQVGTHSIEPEINITKLITDEEIEANQLFFEQCAKRYRKLSGELILKLAESLGVEINVNYPLLSFNPLKNTKQQIGELDGWRYYLHGFHCGFENKKTEQTIEVPLIFGLEFGDLDPYFFTRFIKSTQEYNPLPIPIYEDYADGVRINKKMLALGKFEKINSNLENHFGIVVTDREKVEIHIYKPKADKSGFNY